MATVSCGSDSSSASSAANEADAIAVGTEGTAASKPLDWLTETTTPGQILSKPLAIGIDAKDVQKLIIGSPIQADAIAFRLTDQPVISVQYQLISTSKDELKEITEKTIFGAIEQNELTISMPMLEGCSIVETNNVIEKLSGVCVREVTVMLPANQEIAVYDATSYAAADSLPFNALAWPAKVPENAEALGQMLSTEIDELNYKLLLVERFVAAGKADKFTINDLWPVLNSVSGSSKKLAMIERLADPIKATYGSQGIPADELQLVLDSLWEGDRAKASSLLN